jgi:hypothetical protein
MYIVHKSTLEPPPMSSGSPFSLKFLPATNQARKNGVPRRRSIYESRGGVLPYSTVLDLHAMRDYSDDGSFFCKNSM